MLKLEKDLKRHLGDKYDDKMLHPINISLEIAEYAHRNQKRLDGTPYILHPCAMFCAFKELSETANGDRDKELLMMLGIPGPGVFEVCLLHDVVEDTEYTFEDIAEIFYDKGYKDYFNDCILEPLTLITHNKKEPYPIYIDKVITNPISALVKMLDLSNNLIPFSLNRLEEKEYRRMLNYVKYLKVINDKYHFIERFNEYNSLTNQPKQNTQNLPC